MNVWMSGIAAGLGWMALVGAAQAQEPAPAPTAQPTTRPARVDLPGPIDSLQDIQDTGKMLFKMADANNDGQISQKEAIDLGNLMVGGFFFRADANGDGTVSQDEARQARDALLAQKPILRYILQKGQQARTASGANANGNANAGANGTANPLQGLLTILDTNNDKQIQATELRQAVQTAVQGVFATADTNRDGQLSPVEINASIAGAIRTASQGVFQAADADRNGQLSREEFDRAIVEPANAVFMLLDVNNDGQLSQDEMRAARRFVVSQLRMFQVPEPSNSPRNLIRTGRVPAEGAPATTTPPGQPAPGATPTPGTPR